MKSIIWQTDSKVLVESFRKGQLSNDARGGDSYEYHAINALSANYSITMDENSIREIDENSTNYSYRFYRNRVISLSI